MTTLSIIIPCFNNEKNIPVTFRALQKMETRFPAGVRIEYIFVDDGSRDATLRELMLVKKRYPRRVTVIKLSRNFGANNATLAGLSTARGDCIAILAADLQDPPDLIPSMFVHWQRGVKLVVCTRRARHDAFFSQLLATTFHTIMRRSIFPDAPRGGFDLCLFDSQLQHDILAMKEKNFFLPYLLLWLGYDYVTIPYTRQPRTIGTSAWTLSKRITLFIDSFVSFTYLPIRAITVVGITLSIAALYYALSVVHARLTSGIQVEGWTSLVIILLFVSAFQMIALGIIGEYLWRTLDTTRARPPYIIESTQSSVPKPRSRRAKA